MKREPNISREQPEWEWSEEIIDAVRSVIPKAERSGLYMTGPFRDSLGRYTDEVRIIHNGENPPSFTLNDNLSDGLTLFELKRLLEAKGLHIHRMAAYHAIPAIQQALLDECKKDS